MTINFGTDGWRGVIGRDFNFGNVRRVATAMAHYFTDKKNRQLGDQQSVVIGYDTRFLGEETAMEVAQVFAASGVQPIVSSSPVPTPCVSFMVKERGLLGGVMVTPPTTPPSTTGSSSSPTTEGRQIRRSTVRSWTISRRTIR